MSPRIPADDLPHDIYGIREYGVMLHANAKQRLALRRFHEATGLSDFATRAHVSVHNFGEPTDLGEVMVRLSKLAVDTKPIRVRFAVEGPSPWGSGAAGGSGVQEDQALLAFHRAVRQALDPVTKSLHPPGRKFWPHLTAYLATDPDEAKKAKRLLPRLDLGGGFVASSVELTGRRGPARGGSYTVLASFPFGVRVGPADPSL